MDFYFVAMLAAAGAVVCGVLGWDTDVEWSRFSSAMGNLFDLLIATALLAFIVGSMEHEASGHPKFTTHSMGDDGYTVTWYVPPGDDSTVFSVQCLNDPRGREPTVEQIKRGECP